MASDACARIQDPERWEAWLTEGVPDDARAHAAGCAACAAALADLDRMAEAFEAVAEAEAARVDGLDVSERVLAAIAAGETGDDGAWTADRGRTDDGATRVRGGDGRAPDLIEAAARGGATTEPVEVRRESAPLPAANAATEGSRGDGGLAKDPTDARAPRRGRWAPALAAAAVALAVVGGALLGSEPEEIAIESAAVARWWPGAGAPEGVGEPLTAARRALPGRLQAGEAAASARPVGKAGAVTVAPEAAVTFVDTVTLAALSGSARVESSAQVSLRHQDWALEGAGDFEVAIGDTRRAKAMLNRKTVVGGSVALVVAVYAGWATIETGSETVRQAAPGGLAVDGDGAVSRFGLGGGGGGGDDAPAAGRSRVALTAAPAATATAAQDAPTGAYWSEDDQAVRFALEGEVLDAVSGAGLSSFTLEVEAEALEGYADPQRTLQTDDAVEGRFRLDGLGLGRWRVTARADGYAPVTQHVDLSGVGSDPYLVLPMSGGGRLSGTVVDSQRQPVEGATVGLAACFADRPPQGCQTPTTGSDGRFVLDGVPTDAAFTVRAEHPRLGSTVRPNLRLEPGASENIILELSGRLKVFGVVTRGADHAPAAGVEVVTGDESARAVTGEDGRYTLYMALEQRPRVHVVVRTEGGPPVKFGAYPERRSSEAIRWVEAPTHVAEVEKNFRLAVEDGRLFGRITDAKGRPVAGVPLQLWNTTGWFGKKRGHETFPERTVTDADGRYRIDGVPTKAGYTMSYEDAEGRRHRLGYVNVPEPKPVEANFELGTGRIRGRFVDATTGEPFQISSQACHSLFGAQRLGAGRRYFVEPRCLEGGRFEIVDLAPGEYRLHARLGPEMSSVRFEPKVVTVAPGEIAPEVAIPVEGKEADAWRFRVLDEQGRFVTGLYSRVEAGNRVYTANLRLQDDGTVEASVDRTFETMFIDAQGYEPAKVDLRGRDPSALITVRMRRTAP